MQLMTRPTTWKNSRIVCQDADHTFFASILDNMLVHPVLEDGARVEEESELSSTSASNCGCIPAKSELVAANFIHKNHWWSSLRRCSFHSDCCFVNSGLLSLITGWLCFVWVRAGFLLALRIFAHSGKCGPILQQQIAPNRISERRIYWNLYCWALKNNFGHSVSMVSRLQQKKVLPYSLSLTPRLGRCAHYPLKHIPIVNLDHCE